MGRMKREINCIGIKELPVLNVKRDELAAVVSAYEHNTTLPEGNIFSDVRATAMYSDGSEKSYKVQWKKEDLQNIIVDKSSEEDCAEKSHVYEIEGELLVPEYEEILVAQRADPYVLLAEDGWYYMTASYPVCGTKENEQKIGYDRIVLRRAKTIAGLKDAKEVTIWHQKDSKRLNRYIWAPELHCINGSYYMLFTGSLETENVWGIRPHMLKCIGEDLMDPKNWQTEDESNLYQMTAMESDKQSFRYFSLDMTCFYNKGTYYVIWAEIPEKLSNLYLASVDSERPWQLTSEPILLTSPEYEWEMLGNVKVNEGPSVLKQNGKIYVAFSASATDYTYCVGFLEASEDADLLKKESWKKYDTPFLTSDDFEDQCGPGHNSFTTDENGNVVLIYHARPYECSNAMDKYGHYGKCEYVEQGKSALSDPCRHARVKSIQFAADGLPILHMPIEKEIPAEYRTVKMKVAVEERDRYLFVTFTDGREDGEQIYFAVSEDGLHWEDLNQGNPILTSSIGEMGARDPFILRSVDGKKFYMIATDLRIGNGKGWDVAQHEGSLDLLIWESEDLVHWSKERAVTIGVPGAGCVWAPEAIYDKKREAYLVFFASMVKLEGDAEPKQRIYATYTKDFVTFSESKVYIEHENHVIDTTIVEEKGIYYRFSKDETTKQIRMDCGTDLQGEFKEIFSEALEQLHGVEGPEAYYLEKRKAWCLIVDRFAAKEGYLPLVCSDLKTGDFTVVPEEQYDLGGIKKRHGSVIAITRTEYEALKESFL